MEQNQEYTPSYVTDLARKFRKKSTYTEALLWEIFRNRKFANYKIRRQHPIGRYIVDFYCAKARMVIEVDGGIHELLEVKECDRIRQQEIESKDIKVVRITNKDVKYRLDETLKMLERLLEKRVIERQKH